MLLTEFFKFDTDTNDFRDNRRYNPRKDTSVVKKSDTRKIRLTLRQINQLRLQSEAHEAEKQSEVTFIRHMYGNPPDTEGL